MRQRAITAVAIAALLTVFAAAFAWIPRSQARRDAGIPGCAPLCLTPNLTRPGKLSAGKYQTQFFFAGRMTVSVSKGWVSGEDSTGEFDLWPNASPDAKVIFWEDVYATKAVTPGTWPRVGPLRRTSASLLAWLRNNPNLSVSKPITGKIGTIRARVVDIGVSEHAVNDDPGCPTKACANFVGFPQWDGPYGIARGEASRFYLADVRYGGQRHLFVAVIDGATTAKLKAFLPQATPVIRSVRVPVTPG